jgi:hypothetical protein
MYTTRYHRCVFVQSYLYDHRQTCPCVATEPDTYRSDSVSLLDANYCILLGSVPVCYYGITKLLYYTQIAPPKPNCRRSQSSSFKGKDPYKQNEQDVQYCNVHILGGAQKLHILMKHYNILDLSNMLF